MMNIVYKRLERLKLLLFLLQRGSVSRWSEGRVISTQPDKVFGAGLHLLSDSLHLWSQPSWGWDLTVFVVDSTLSQTTRDSWGFYFALQFSSLLGHCLSAVLTEIGKSLSPPPESAAFWRFREFRSLASRGNVVKWIPHLYTVSHDLVLSWFISVFVAQPISILHCLSTQQTSLVEGCEDGCSFDNPVDSNSSMSTHKALKILVFFFL